MKTLAQIAAEKAARERKRVWRWCRRENGFSDQPRWRVIAARVGLPLYQVVAFVNRLEELANDAGNKGFGRGEVSHFDASEFAAALAMPTDDAERIFAALENVGWVCDGHVADFWNRNKDEEDETAPLRQRRKRARATVRRVLAPLARMGLVSASVRVDIESRLDSLKTMADVELFALVGELDLALSTGRPVTRDSRSVTRDSHRDSVTVTGEKSTGLEAQSVDNIASSIRGAAEKASDKVGADAADMSTGHAVTPEQWISTVAVKAVVEELNVGRVRAETLLQRWMRDLPNAAVLKAILEGALATKYTGDRLHNLIVDQIRRHRGQAEQGPQLPMGPTPIDTQRRRAGNE